MAALAGFLAAGAAVCSGAEVLDRVVASIGNVAITSSDVMLEYRFERFLDGEWPAPPPDAATMDKARERLTYQTLLLHEENPGPGENTESAKAAADRLVAVRKEYSHLEAFQQALHDLGMTEADVLARLTQDELMLRLIDQRLRPAAIPSDDAVAEYYRSTFVPEFEKKNNGAAAPPLTQVESGIQEILVERRINELLDEWIEELKPTSDVRFHSF